MADIRYPTREQILEVLDYDRSTGSFSWKADRKRWGGLPCGGISGEIPYHRIRIDWWGTGKRQQISTHRLVWIVETDQNDSDIEIDHINGDQLDNRIGNLRIATPSQNSSNTKGRGRTVNHDLPRGVYPVPSGKYIAAICHKLQKIRLGTFDTIEDASQAYQDAADRFHGEFAYHRRN